MNKQILLTLLIVFAVVLSASAVSASEVNVTDSYATNLVDDTQDVSVPMENTADISQSSVSSDSNVDNDPSKVSLSSEEVLESEDSNTLSTNNSDSNVLSSSDDLYGNSNEMIMPVIVKFSSDGSYKMTLDETAYENMFENMIDALLEEEGYFEMDDAKKAEYLTTEFGVETEEELYELFYEIYLDERPITEWEGVLSSMPMQKKGYWAVNGDYLYFADTESQRDAFLNNPKSYKYDTIKTSLTRGPNNFAIADGEDSFVFVKQ